MNISNELNSLAKEFALHRLKNELDYYSVSGDTKKVDEILHKIKDFDNNIMSDREKVRQTFYEIDKVPFMKPWKKMLLIHKTIKLKQYISQYPLDKQEQLNIILLNALENSELHTDSVIYDDKNCCITNIIGLVDTNGIFSLENKKPSRSKKII